MLAMLISLLTIGNDLINLFGDNMSNKIRNPLLLIYFIGLAFLLFFSVDKYSWMYDMDPSITVGSIQNNSSNRNVVSFFILCVLIGIQIFSFISEKNNVRKFISVLLAITAIFLFILK
ncbi:Uncharacterised protein [Yersinia similis]|uniref:Uncharacterized protein n=1 Tax=Yersinia similis TaxID=367190 RepID=A0A0T9QRZ1_9GAMM|nr:Uncharacterised protein [Yersinia similis]CNI24496.1 Uncharacterised protein [Yersinia similis]